jgi:asparagine synthase (glutamine-hydrolysing)
VRKIPSKYKLQHYQTKYILKKSLKSVLPDEILYWPKKGFGIPVGKWFRDKSLSIDEENSIDNLDFNFVKKMHKEHLSGGCDHRSFLWSYWLLSNYAQING